MVNASRAAGPFKPATAEVTLAPHFVSLVTYALPPWHNIGISAHSVNHTPKAKDLPASISNFALQVRATSTNFPFLSPAQALCLARIAVALLFAIHAVVRIINGSIPRFAAFMESAGFPDGTATVWAITATELVAATQLIAGRNIRVACAALMTIAVGGILLIHRHFGWFVGEHGTGGSEFSVALIVLLIVVSAGHTKWP
jgi:putative oxidoreductase